MNRNIEEYEVMKNNFLERSDSDVTLQQFGMQTRSNDLKNSLLCKLGSFRRRILEHVVCYGINKNIITKAKELLNTLNRLEDLIQEKTDDQYCDLIMQTLSQLSHSKSIVLFIKEFKDYRFILEEQLRLTLEECLDLIKKSNGTGIQNNSNKEQDLLFFIIVDCYDDRIMELILNDDFSGGKTSWFSQLFIPVLKWQAALCDFGLKSILAFAATFWFISSTANVIHGKEWKPIYSPYVILTTLGLGIVYPIIQILLSLGLNKYYDPSNKDTEHAKVMKKYKLVIQKNHPQRHFDVLADLRLLVFFIKWFWNNTLSNLEENITDLVDKTIVRQIKQLVENKPEEIVFNPESSFVSQLPQGIKSFLDYCTQLMGANKCAGLIAILCQEMLR